VQSGAGLPLLHSLKRDAGGLQKRFGTAEQDAGSKLINNIVLGFWQNMMQETNYKLINNIVFGFWQNMMQETVISKDGDFGKHCLEIWQLCCFAKKKIHKNPLYELHWVSFLLLNAGCNRDCKNVIQ
jgi:hypothetical protein